MKKEILQGLVKKLEGEREVIQAEIGLYLDSGNVIPAHTNFAEEIENFVDKLAHVHEKLKLLKFMVDNIEL